MRTTGRRESPLPLPKPLLFVGDARDELSALPLPVRRRFGYDLRDVQNGEMPLSASPFEGSRAGDVLTAFQKKSRSGIATPPQDIQTVQARYAQARADYEQRFGPQT